MWKSFALCFFFSDVRLFSIFVSLDQVFSINSLNYSSKVSTRHSACFKCILFYIHHFPHHHKWVLACTTYPVHLHLHNLAVQMCTLCRETVDIYIPAPFKLENWLPRGRFLSLFDMWHRPKICSCIYWKETNTNSERERYEQLERCDFLDFQSCVCACHILFRVRYLAIWILLFTWHSPKSM